MGNGSRCGRRRVTRLWFGLWCAGMAAQAVVAAPPVAGRDGRAGMEAMLHSPVGPPRLAPLLGETPALRWGALGLRGAGVISLASAAGGGGVLWAYTFLDGVWKSPDGGVSWTQQPLGPRDGYFAVVADPADPLTVYAYGDAGVAKSRDGGSTWRSINATPTQAFAIAPSAAAVLYLAGPSGFGQGGAMLRSADGGDTWKTITSLANPIEGPFQLIVDPTDPNDVFGLAAAFHLDTTPVLMRTADGGLTWSSAGPEPAALTSLVIDPRQSATIYAVADRLLVVRSRDRGATWEPANAGLPPAETAGPWPWTRRAVLCCWRPGRSTRS
jgi:hypothetical protein